MHKGLQDCCGQLHVIRLALCLKATLKDYFQAFLGAAGDKYQMQNFLRRARAYNAALDLETFHARPGTTHPQRHLRL